MNRLMCREGAWGLRFDVKKEGSFAFAGLLFLYAAVGEPMKGEGLWLMLR